MAPVHPRWFPLGIPRHPGAPLTCHPSVLLPGGPLNALKGKHNAVAPCPPFYYNPSAAQPSSWTFPPSYSPCTATTHPDARDAHLGCNIESKTSAAKNNTHETPSRTHRSDNDSVCTAPKTGTTPTRRLPIYERRTYPSPAGYIRRPQDMASFHCQIALHQSRSYLYESRGTPTTPQNPKQHL